MEFFEHATLGFCWWDLPVLILILAITAWFLVKRHKLKEEKRNYKIN